MKIEEFERSLAGEMPPESLDPLLNALWHDAKGDWEEAHRIAQEIETRDGSLVHAYLHRKEGDKGNAQYWYRIAGRPFPLKSLAEEWKEITEELLAKSSSS